MCGIAGIVALDRSARADPTAVRAMSQRLSHRGPDGEGLWTSPSGRACFAHRRLSVIDLALGAQPMVDPDGAFGLVFNGEIYNYLEIRAELEKQGVVFRTSSDTEVLAAVLRLRGVSGLDAVRGMFALGAWNDDTGELLLVRDRIGKKPLYYFRDERFLYFCSSLAALRSAVPQRPEIDPQAVEAYLTLGYVPAPLTIFKGFRKFEAAQYLRIGGGVEEMGRFWSPADKNAKFDGSFTEAVDVLQEILEQSTRMRLRSDVPLGVYLSGGIDSSLVAAAAARQSGGALETFSIGFSEQGFDESGYAAEVSRRLATRHTLIRANADLLSLVPELVRHFGEPFADSSALPMWLLAQRTRPSVTVALSGDGGDEGFAGYRWYETARSLQRAARLAPAGLTAGAARLLHGAASSYGSVFGKASRALTMLSAGGDALQFARQRALFSPEELRPLRGPELRTDRPEAVLAFIAEVYDEAEGLALRRMRHADIRTHLADGLMPKVDVTSMAHGLEVRAPLLDHELISFALSLPDGFLQDEHGGKRILRALLARYLPGLSFMRPKQGFTVPLTAWFGQDYDLRLEQLKRSQAFAESGLIDTAGVSALLAEQRAGLRDHGERLFALLMLDEWLNAEMRGA